MILRDLRNPHAQVDGELIVPSGLLEAGNWGRYGIWATDLQVNDLNEAFWRGAVVGPS
jgi:hypothetical protein